MTTVLAECLSRSETMWTVCSLEGSIVDISPSVERFTGLARSALIGRDVWDLSPNMTREGWPEMVARVRRQAFVEAETVSSPRWGGVRLIRGRLSAVTLSDGREVILCRSEPLTGPDDVDALGDDYWFRCITRFGDDGFWFYEVASGRVTMNRQWYEMFGRPRQTSEHIEALKARVHPDDLVIADTLYTALIEGSTERLSMRLRQRHEAGHYVWTRHRAYVVGRDPSGRTTGIVGHDVDISSEVEAQQRARRGEARLSQLIERVPVAVMVYDADMALKRWNDAAARMLGVAYDEVPAELQRQRARGWALIDETGQPVAPTEHPLARAIRELEPVGWRVLGMRRDDGAGWGLMSATPELDEQGRLVEVVCVIADITETRKLEAGLARAQRLESLGRLAGGVAHDFNNLLTVVTSVAEMLDDSLPAELALGEDIAELKHAARRGSQLTRQLLRYARQAPPQRRAVDPGAVVRASSALLRRLLPVDIELEIDVPDALWVVSADPGHLDQILVNLTVNAADAMRADSGRLTISLDNHVHADPHGRPVEWVRLRVRDTGCGMTEDVRSRAVEPFFTTKEVGEGTGLGLSTCFSLVRQSGGALDIQSAPGAGTTVEILLPRAPAGAVGADPPAAPEIRADGELVLLVEDEAPVRRVAQRALVASGYRVEIARDGQEALRRFDEGIAPDLLVTDVAMPGVDGPTLVRTLRRTWPTLPVLFTSGHDDPTLNRHGVDRAAVDFLPKPFGPRTLVERVHALLQRSQTLARTRGRALTTSPSAPGPRAGSRAMTQVGPAE